MRNTPGMNIPEKPILQALAKRPIQTGGEQAKTMQEAYRGVNWVPGQSDYVNNPSDRKIEVLDILFKESYYLGGAGT